MGFRFRKTVKLGKGLSVNLSKSGGSVSFGPRGAKTNISKRGVRSTVSIPGTGISYSATNTTKKRATKKTKLTTPSHLNPVQLVDTKGAIPLQTRDVKMPPNTKKIEKEINKWFNQAKEGWLPIVAIPETDKSGKIKHWILKVGKFTPEQISTMKKLVQ